MGILQPNPTGTALTVGISTSCSLGFMLFGDSALWTVLYDGSLMEDRL